MSGNAFSKGWLGKGILSNAEHANVSVIEFRGLEIKTRAILLDMKVSGALFLGVPIVCHDLLSGESGGSHQETSACLGVLCEKRGQHGAGDGRRQGLLQHKGMRRLD